MNDNTPMDAADVLQATCNGSRVMMLGHAALWLWPLALFAVVETISALM